MTTLQAITAVTGIILQAGFLIYAMVLANKGEHQKATFYMVGAIFYLLSTKVYS